MCGIAGVFSGRPLEKGSRELVERFNELQRHRGPDDKGVYESRHCILGHRRLSIIDLSAAGHQPFLSDPPGKILVYNGEIYNYLELREELRARGRTFRTDTDTEVLLKMYQEFGPACLDRLNGMFAFAIYDEEQQELFLARDRIGIKPLYYTYRDDILYFSSEIKALRAVPGLSRAINEQALFDYLVLKRTDVFDETFFKDVRRIPKGHYGIAGKDGLQLHQWWNPGSFVNTREDAGLDESCREVDSLMSSAVDFRMRSDVPVGSCLSGGLDSSIILGILANAGSLTDTYATFTAAFPGCAMDETGYIDRLRERIPFTNHRTYPTAESAFACLEDFVYTTDEPTPNTSFYAQYEVMRLAREKGITVLLDGQGGDEGFAGYHYLHGFHVAGMLRQGRIFRAALALLHMLRRRQKGDAYTTLLFSLLPGAARRQAILQSRPFLKRDFLEHHIGHSRIYNEFFDAPDINSSLARHFQYKLEHLLRTEDRVSMAFSLEARVPFLDHRLVEYLLGVSGSYKISKGETKFLQKRALGKYTIPEILQRKDKIGFASPTDAWMATDVWKGATTRHYRMLCEKYPHIFRPEMVPNGGQMAWMINQLGVWDAMTEQAPRRSEYNAG